jgi:ABC-type uncharacterized transport system permease subunit
MTTHRHWHAPAEALLLPLLALAGALVLFGVFVWFGGQSPLEVWSLLFRGAFGDAFSWQNTLQRAAPLMLTALAVALPAQTGLTVIGGEGALVLGALGCAALPYLVPLPSGVPGSVLVLCAGALLGALWVALAGVLRQWRAVNETISSLLLSYIAIAIFKHLVEGPMRDPASLNKPSTRPLEESLRIGAIAPDSLLGDVHWGLAIGVAACVIFGAWLSLTAQGFSMRVVGGNARTARLVGLPASALIVLACALGGGCAGLAGAIEVAAVQNSANASVIAGMGYTGILVSFVARHNPWAIPPVAILFGGFAAAGSLLQRRLGLPDASVLVLQGFAFVCILGAEALRGRLLPMLASWPGMAAARPPEGARTAVRGTEAS